MQKRTNVTIECEAAEDLLFCAHNNSVSLYTIAVDGGSLQINANHIPQLIDALAALIAFQNPKDRYISLVALQAKLEGKLKRG